MIGILFVFIFALVATLLSELSFFKDLAISPLIIGILLGMIYANSVKKYFSNNLEIGIVFCTKTVLRVGIVLYGFRLTFQNLQDVGIQWVF
ncbi:MAG: putative sulfate exporter family transporter [Aliarcobacter sp.]|nr:putative sulfate exporter family transporter [Aliarcobacter sp.]